jgi:hypothetical protein
MVADNHITNKKFSLHSKGTETTAARLDINDFDSKILLWLTQRDKGKERRRTVWS